MASKTADAFPRRFVFHGNAVAAEVFLTRIGSVKQTVINPVTGQSSLPVIGGESSSEVLTPTFPAQLAGVFSYSAARTHAKGIFDGEDAVTTVDASVHDVRVTNSPVPKECDDLSPIEFRAGTLSLSLRSTHPPKGQPCIEFAETPQFAGLSLKGLPIELELNEELMRLSRWKDLEKRFRTNRAFFDSCPFGVANPKRPLTFGQDIPYTPSSYAVCSFVRSVKWGDRIIAGHVLEQRGFGTIYFGEILLNDKERRVTMVRMQLGSNNSGQAVFAEGDPNGTTIPPR
ncbi:MAG: hypothetical protein ABSF64_19135 [Bryobacteraceae bacterium]|jgi:hypothetical protein